MTLPLNGFTLVAALPVVIRERINYYVVVVDRETTVHRYVVAQANNLTDHEWNSSYFYTDNLALAIERAYQVERTTIA